MTGSVGSVAAQSKVIPDHSGSVSSSPQQSTTPLNENDVLTLDGASLDCETLLLAGAGRSKVEIAADSMERILIGRTLVEEIAKGDAPAYGITTGVGSQKEFAVASDGMNDYNRRLARAHSTHAGGAILLKNRVRAALVILANQFSSGLSGVSAPLMNLILDQINNSEMPEIYAHGTVGASDLIPMAQIANWLQSQPAAEVHHIPGPKETLSLINNNSMTLASGADVLMEARAVSKLANLSLALSLEACRANLNSISALVNQAHRRTGQASVSRELRELLKDSHLWANGAARRIQDPLSFRCGSQVHGALHEMLDRAVSVWNDELNTVTDNPIMDTEYDCARSHGNMDTTRMTLAIDGVRQAFAKVADLAGERIHKQQWTEFSGLPTGFSDLNSPLGGVQFLNLGHLASSFITSTKFGRHLLCYFPLVKSLMALKIQQATLTMPYPLTLEGELNKLAANISIGRNMAGVHYFSDYYDSLRMGEAIAIGMLEEQAVCYPTDPFVMSLRTFDGDMVQIGAR